ncbi:MAG: patatin-like phospholipase family protein [Myxococcaceae bacterium]
MGRRAVVLAGGSFAASAWESGLVAGLAEAGLDLRQADLFIGTSAGARVALHLANGTEPRQLFDLQKVPLGGGPGGPSGPRMSFDSVRAECAEAKAAGGGLEAILTRFGAIALKHAPAADLEARRKTMAAQLPVQAWPEKPVSVVALNARTGQRRAFTKESGVSLIDVMLATTASFGAAPVELDGQPYFDGGYHSSNNADLAAGFDEVFVLSLRAPPFALALVPLSESVEALQRTGAKVTVLQPDEASEAAVNSGRPGDPSIRGPIAEAAYQQGKRFVRWLS